MKVIKEGSWKLHWEMELPCSEKQCGALLLVSEGDVKPVDYSNGNKFYFECPVCGSHVGVPEKDLPLRVQKEVDKHKKYSSSWGYD